MRSLGLALLALSAAPLHAQEASAPASDVARATAEIEAHRVNLRVGCPIPVPALWNAPPWEQRAAAIRRNAFERCLSGAMLREQDRLEQLGWRLQDLQAAEPNADWSEAEQALERKWSELDTLAGKLRTRENWANTAVEILDTFTGPGAPFGPRPAYPGYPYRPDTSVSMRGVR